MPIYQYQCTACAHSMEALQKMSDPLLVDCPSCGDSTLKKQVTAAAFKLKGTGWYETDFKNSGQPPKANSTGDSSDKPSKKNAANDSSVDSDAEKPATAKNNSSAAVKTNSASAD